MSERDEESCHKRKNIIHFDDCFPAPSSSSIWTETSSTAVPYNRFLPCRPPCGERSDARPTCRPYKQPPQTRHTSARPEGWQECVKYARSASGKKSSLNPRFSSLFLFVWLLMRISDSESNLLNSFHKTVKICNFKYFDKV